jgi:hypothetical protein
MRRPLGSSISSFFPGITIDLGVYTEVTIGIVQLKKQPSFLKWNFVVIIIVIGKNQCGCGHQGSQA